MYSFCVEDQRGLAYH